MNTDKEYAEDIAYGPDPDTDSGPEETEEDAAEAHRLLTDAESGNQGDWTLDNDSAFVREGGQ